MSKKTNCALIRINTYEAIDLAELYRAIADGKKDGNITSDEFDYFIKRLILEDGEQACVDKWQPFLNDTKKRIHERNVDNIVNTLEGDLVNVESNANNS
jgi:DNA-binding ferritin-like protein (Dps family)